MLDWDDVRFFLVLHRQGSHARAARHLRVDPTTVARRLGALEAALEATLFERTPSGLAATSAGLALARTAERIEAEVLSSEREIRGGDARLEGSVVITAGDGLVTHFIVPWLVDFRREHPGITLELRSHKRALDIARREADVAVRLFKPRETSLVATRAGHLRFGIYASKAYLARHDAPRTLEDLGAHDWIAWDARLDASAQSQWLLCHVPSARVGLRANTTGALIAACAAGHGLAILPAFAAADDERLRAVVLDAPPMPVRDVWIVCHADARKSARTQAVVRFLTRRFKTSA